jgi:hypothetical protein
MLTALIVLTSAVSFTAWILLSDPGTAQNKLDAKDLDSKADTALTTLVGGPGWPPHWASSARSIDNVAQLGLRNDDPTIAALDPAKLDALARGHYHGASPTNGFADYGEARTALGLDGYEFHL